MTTRVVNYRGGKVWTVWVMRGSKWGNPHRLAPRASRKARLECLVAHALYLEESGLIDEVAELRGETLACCCAPAPCHADTLARCADADDPRAELARVLEELRAELAEIHRAETAQQTLI